jgi:hypothetical protein
MTGKLAWEKSSYSGSEGNCVEVAKLTGDGRVVRDSKDVEGPALRFGSSQWRDFITRIKEG